MLAALLATLCLAVDPAPGPDIIIFLLDEVAAADMQLYGGPIACPNIEALAANGVRFSRAYANSRCAVTRRSLMTGHWWLAGNGASCPPGAISSTTPSTSEVFLPEALPAYTSGIVGKWHLGGNPLGGPLELAPLAHGFTYWSAGLHGNVASCGGTGYFNWVRVDADPFTHSTGPSSVYEGIAVRATFKAGWPAVPSPRLAVVCSNLAHEPFSPPPAALLPSGYVVGATARERFEALVVALDTTIGQMLGVVDLSSTVVIVVGDNGTPANVAPVVSKAKGSPFERGVRVPLVISGPGVVNPGRVSDELTHVVDLWATAIEIGGGSVPAGSPYPTAGCSLVPVLEDVSHLPLHDFILVGSEWGTSDGDIASISQAGIKLRWRDVDGDKVPESEQLYDLNLDPDETVNVISNPSYAADVAAHRAFLQAAALP